MKDKYKINRNQERLKKWKEAEKKVEGDKPVVYS